MKKSYSIWHTRLLVSAVAAVVTVMIMTAIHGSHVTSAALTASPMPAVMRGIWEGTIQRDPRFVAGTFTGLMAIADANIGEVSGTDAHPSFTCGGPMRMQSATADSFVATTHFTFGKCTDGRHLLNMQGDGSMAYEWHDPTSDRVDRGTLRRTSGRGSSISPSLLGVWEGTTISDNKSSLVTITLVNGSPGDVVGTAVHPEFECGARMTLVSTTATTIEAKSAYFFGSCASGRHVLQLQPDGSLSYAWHDPTSQRVDRGTLHRISGPQSQSCVLTPFGDDAGNPVRQDTGSWSGDDYGGGQITVGGNTIFLPFRYYGPGRDTIAAWGCYLTSAVMAVNYLAARQGSSFRTDPGTLNRWLQHHEGGYYTGGPKPSVDDPQYVESSLVNTSEVAAYARENGVRMAYLGGASRAGETAAAFVARTSDTINADMCASNPVIVGVTNPYGNHYVATSGKIRDGDGATWQIHDPLKASVSSLRSAYSNQYRQYVRFGDTAQDRVVSFAVRGDVEVLVTDPQGHMSGRNGVLGISLSAIPGASYGDEGFTAAQGSGSVSLRVLTIVAPILGEYQLRVTHHLGTTALRQQPGAYDLDVFGLNNDGNGYLTSVSGNVTGSQSDVRIIRYVSTSGQPLAIGDPIADNVTVRRIVLPFTSR